MAELDPRTLRISIDLNNQRRTYENLSMVVQGQKFANANQGECKLSIINMDREVVNSILTEASPFNTNPTPKRITVEAGRESSGYDLLYVGDIFRANSTQPPDQVLSIRALSGWAQGGNIVARSKSGTSNLSEIVAEVGNDVGAQVDFQATDKSIANYSYNGPASKQVDQINQLAPVDAYVDNDVLVVKDQNVPKQGVILVINPEDIVGKPEVTEQGVKVTFLFTNQAQLGRSN